MESLYKETCERFTELLASPAPVPGGGGASALAGAVAIALGDMVGELTVGKKKYAAVEEEMKELMARAQDLRVRFLHCIDEDAQAFEPLSRAYGLSKDAPGRDEVLEKCLKDAAAAPLHIFDLSCEAIDVLKEFGEKGSRLMISDAATGAALARAAMYGAAINVLVNTKLMKDRPAAEQINAHIDERLARYSALADRIWQDVAETMR